MGAVPFVGWSLGTLLGAVVGSILPDALSSALGIALYAMFVAIIIPPAKTNHALPIVILSAAGLSCALRYLPAVIIICAVVVSAIGAIFFPIKEDAT